VPAPALAVDVDMKFWKRSENPSNGKLPIATSQQQLPVPGIYKYDYQELDERSRVHLRIDGELSTGDANGILLVNANRVIHLNPTAALMAYLSLEDTPG